MKKTTLRNLIIGLMLTSCMGEHRRRPADSVQPAQPGVSSRFLAFDLAPEDEAPLKVNVSPSKVSGQEAVKIEIESRSLSYGACQYSYCLRTSLNDCRSGGLVGDSIVDPTWADGDYRVKVTCCSLAGNCQSAGPFDFHQKPGQNSQGQRDRLSAVFAAYQEYFRITREFIYDAHRLLTEVGTQATDQSTADFVRSLKNQVNLGVDFISAVISSDRMTSYIDYSHMDPPETTQKAALSSGDEMMSSPMEEMINNQKEKISDARTILLFGVLDFSVSLAVFSISLGTDAYAKSLKNRVAKDERLQGLINQLKDLKLIKANQHMFVPRPEIEAKKINQELLVQNINERVKDLTGYKTHEDFKKGTKNLQTASKGIKITAALYALGSTAYALIKSYRELALGEEPSPQQKIVALMQRFAVAINAARRAELAALHGLAPAAP